ncbi:MAG: discoidin domain-containing protein [Polyangiales bacterium]
MIRALHTHGQPAPQTSSNPRVAGRARFALASVLASLLFVGCEPVEVAPTASFGDGGVPAQEAASAEPEAEAVGGAAAALTATTFCWKDSYGRGAGTVPDACPGQQKDGGLCYPYCAGGYYGVGPVCWQACPSGWRDDGTACWLDASIISANNSACPWYDTCGLTLAPHCSTCPSGYVNDGCTCRRDAQMFYKGSYGRGAGSPMSCNSSLQYDAGLCYTPCANGYQGVGPVCWGQCPASAPVACGAGCAVSQEACANEVITQVQATLECAANLAEMAYSLGTSAAVKYAVSAGLSAAEKAALKARIKAELKEAFKDLAETELEAMATASANAANGEAFDYASLDPTGIASLVQAFNRPFCASLSPSNVALGRPAYQSSVGWGGSPSRAVDGNTDGNYGSSSVTHTNLDQNAWWQVDLQRSRHVQRVVVHNRTDCCADRLSNFYVEVRNAQNQGVARRNFSGVAGQTTTFDFGDVEGNSVVVQLYGTNYLSLAEVQVIGY